MRPVNQCCVTTAILLTTTALAQGQARFDALDQSFSANDLTPDGRYVVGNADAGGAYIWSRADGYTLIGGSSAVAVSDDGTIVFGEDFDPVNETDEAAIWNAVDGWQIIGPAPTGTGCNYFTSAYELNADGTAAVGLGWDNCSGQGFLWTQATGTQALQMLASGNNRASVISADGTLVGGFAQGSFSRTPAVWSADTSGVVLDPPTGDIVGEVHGIRDDGSLLLGEWGGRPFKWHVDTGLELFDSVIAAWSGIPTDIADDETIVGFDSFMLSRQAWIKPNGGSAVNLHAYLTGLGVTGMPPALDVCQAISTSGNVIIGHNSFFSGWIVDLCPSDLDGSGTVGFGDVLAILSAWDNVGGFEDLDESGNVGFGDLLLVLSDWGPCP